MSLVGKTALVTGGSTGIGLGIAQELLARGATVVAASRRLDSGPLEHDSGRFHAVALDVTDAKQVGEVVTGLGSRFGGIDIVVANSGLSVPGLVADIEPDRWSAVIRTNVDGVFNTVNSALPWLAKSDAGRIITVSSLLANSVFPFSSAYSASKAAVESFTKVVAAEVGKDGITANCLSLGFIDAGMGKALQENAGLWAKYSAKLSTGRPGTAAEVAEVAAFLASSASSYVNGAVIAVDGGILG
ncbi:SDR family NAD(P)-dependent oxidoreductase [Rhodococcoides kyotonense]|nr:SDR family oxidoreductase [Rhodococcus kyotonensis]